MSAAAIAVARGTILRVIARPIVRSTPLPCDRPAPAPMAGAYRQHQ